MEVGGQHLVFLPRYSPQEEDYTQVSEQQLMERFLEGLEKVFPDFHRDSIVEAKLIQERHVQPLYVLDYGNRIPSFQTPLDGVYIANTSMVKNATLNNNAVLELAENVSELIQKS